MAKNQFLAQREENAELFAFAQRYMDQFGPTPNFLGSVTSRWVSGKALTTNQLETLKKVAGEVDLEALEQRQKEREEKKASFIEISDGFYYRMEAFRPLSFSRLDQEKLNTLRKAHYECADRMSMTPKQQDWFERSISYLEHRYRKQIRDRKIRSVKFDLQELQKKLDVQERLFERLQSEDVDERQKQFEASGKEFDREAMVKFIAEMIDDTESEISTLKGQIEELEKKLQEL
ncbi:hypothetical protein [Streptomyces sp. CoH17]|uniref:hypothetical protein n=1 Tax=Streptomyces sp. CoH17 TaxID=2992806 RepID=UPI00226E4B25|nr:hypothetical protein [Streptomyces sp. CoH17]